MYRRKDDWPLERMAAMTKGSDKMAINPEELLEKIRRKHVEANRLEMDDEDEQKVRGILYEMFVWGETDFLIDLASKAIAYRKAFESLEKEYDGHPDFSALMRERMDAIDEGGLFE